MRPLGGHPRPSLTTRCRQRRIPTLRHGRVPTAEARVITVNTGLTRPEARPRHLALKDRHATDRRREHCPADKIAITNTTSETIINLNRLRGHTSTRTGRGGIIEATMGFGRRPHPQRGPPDETAGPGKAAGWFLPFMEGYDGTDPAVALHCNGVPTSCVLDTGAGCNLVGTDALAELMPDYRDHMTPTHTRARDVRDLPVPLAGKVRLSLQLGETTKIETTFEVVEDKDLLILGNPFLYDQDLVIIAREGFGTRSALPPARPSRKATTYALYAAEDTLLDRDDVTTIRVTTGTPRRKWSADINKPFLVESGEDPGHPTLHPTLSSMQNDGTMIALINTRGLAQDVAIEKGALIGTATTEYEQAEQLVTAVMADLIDVEKEIRHVTASQLVEDHTSWDGMDMEVEPPGFEWDGPKNGTAGCKKAEKQYDTERENEGATPETAVLHTRDPKEREKVRRLLEKHRNLFSKSNYDIGHFLVDGQVQKVKLTLSDSTPIIEKYRNMSPAKREAAEQILNELEKAKIISRKASQFASQAVWVTKAAPEMTLERANQLGIPFIPGSKDTASPRNLRFCQDYRLLNARLQSVNWPLPNIKGLLARLKDRKVVTLLDASHSFFCIELDEQSKLYTGFQTCERQYVMNRLAMGLKCSSGILNACLARTLAGLENISFPYSDNIIVASKDEKSHTEDLGKVLAALEEHGWKFKLAKCHIGVTKRLRIFGMDLDLERGYMAPDPSKAEALRDTKIPSTRKQLKSFLGGIGYFVECLPDIGGPLATLHEFTKAAKDTKETTIKWTKEGQDAFREIIKILRRRNEVALPDWNLDFHLTTDAGPQHVASMLAQINEKGDWVPIGFWTKKLSKAECNLSQVEREALAVVYGLKQTSYYTAHAKVYIHCDNQPFVLLQKYSSQSQKLARWKLFVESFDVTLVWEPAKSAGMSFVDFLSRPPDKKLANKRITKEQVANLPKGAPTGIFNREQYEKILEDLVNKQETSDQGEQAVSEALRRVTPTINGKPATRKQWNIRARMTAIAARPRLGLGTPSRATAVGRRPANNKEATIEVILNESPHLNLEQLQQLQKQCSKLGEIYKNIEGHPGFLLHDGVLLKAQNHGGIERIQMAIPVCIADDLVGDLHRGATTCHAGKKKLIKMIQTRFYIPQLAKRVDKIVDNCSICGYYKPRKTGGARPDARRISADGPGQIWAVDHIQITSTPDHLERTSILCFVDLYSHYVVCRAVPKTLTAEAAADAFLEEVVAKFGVCKAILSDNGPDMDNDLIREMANLLGIRKLTIAPGSPKSNGIVEKVQGLILNAIKLQGAQYKVRPDRFADLLTWAALCHNATPYQNIDPPLSPAEIFLGRSIPEATFFAFNNAQYACQNLTQFSQRMAAAQATIAEIIGAKERWLRDMEIKRKILQAKDWQFPPGTIVAVRDKTQARKEANVKLRPRYRGAFIVVKETPTSCMVRPYSSETILSDMETDLDVTRGRGRKLPKYKVMKCDKGDLKKLKQLLFYSMPLARKFAEQLSSPDPDPGRQYMVVDQDDQRDTMVELEEPADQEEHHEEEETRKRPLDSGHPLEPAVKLARLAARPTFPFEEDTSSFY